MKRIIITGPTGAIGMALIQKCIDEKIEVLAICHKGSKRISQIPDSKYIHILEADLQDYEDMDISKLPEQKYDVFFHLAWNATIGAGRNDMYLQNENVKYSLDAVNLAKRLQCHTFIGTGSQAEYGRVEGKLTDQTATFPETGYGIAKLCAGQMTRIQCKQLGVRHIWTRILSIYGPYDSNQTMISTGIRKMLSGEKPSFSPAEQLWDYLYSEDAANALFLLALSGKDGAVYPIGSGKAKQLKDYIEEMRQAVEEQAQMTAETGIGMLPYRENQVMYLCADISKLQEDTKFQMQVDFNRGIRKTIHWMMEECKKDA